MRDFQSKRSYRRLIYSKFSIAALALVVVFLASSVWDIYQKNAFSRQNAKNSALELRALEERKESLEARIGKLGTDRGVEEEIRRNLSVAKEGEQVLVIIDEEKAASTTSGSEPGFWKTLFKRD